jgi:hypothetical protein
MIPTWFECHRQTCLSIDYFDETETERVEQRIVTIILHLLFLFLQSQRRDAEEGVVDVVVVSVAAADVVIAAFLLASVMTLMVRPVTLTAAAAAFWHVVVVDEQQEAPEVLLGRRTAPWMDSTWCEEILCQVSFPVQQQVVATFAVQQQLYTR